MEFTMHQPERMDFRQNWHVALKSLFIPNKIVAFADCYVKYYYYHWPFFDSMNNDTLKLKSNHHSTIESFLHQFNLFLEIYKIKIHAKIVDGQVGMVYYDWKEWTYSNSLTLSPNLANILGFHKEREEYILPFNKTSTQVASHATNHRPVLI